MLPIWKPPPTVGYAYALGSAQAAWRFAGAELRRAAALSAVSLAWDTYRRDAGAGDVGSAHNATATTAQLLFTEDPRRDALLLWLADHAVPPIAEAALMVARLVGATRKFGVEEQALLDAARDGLTHPDAAPGPIEKIIVRCVGADALPLESVRALAAAVDRLRDDVGFLEGTGAEVRHALPSGTLRCFVPAEPAGCWALNLALLARGMKPGGVSPAGLVSRVLFRSNLELEEIASRLIEGASAAWTCLYEQVVRLEAELSCGRDALAHLSRNARTRDAWLLVAALGACTRTQLARALHLSRAGADIQARVLADAGLVVLSAGGRITWAHRRALHAAPEPPTHGPLSAAISDVEASLSAIDRLLTQAAR